MQGVRQMCRQSRRRCWGGRMLASPRRRWHLGPAVARPPACDKRNSRSRQDLCPASTAIDKNPNAAGGREFERGPRDPGTGLNPPLPPATSGQDLATEGQARRLVTERLAHDLCFERCKQSGGRQVEQNCSSYSRKLGISALRLLQLKPFLKNLVVMQWNSRLPSTVLTGSAQHLVCGVRQRHVRYK